MATAANRAGRNREARQRLEAAFVALSERLGVEIPPEPRTMKDPGLQPIVEIERFADVAEAVLAALDATPVADTGDGDPEDDAPDYEAMTVADLKGLLAERELAFSSDARKAELIALLVADDAEQDAPPADDPEDTGDGEPEGGE